MSGLGYQDSCRARGAIWGAGFRAFGVGFSVSGF